MVAALYVLAFLVFTAGLCQHCYANGVGIVAAIHQSSAAWKRCNKYRVYAWLLVICGLAIGIAAHAYSS